MMMEVSPTLGEFTKAFVAAQANFRTPTKNKKNPHFKSAYADLEEILDCCVKALNKAGIAFMQFPWGDGAVCHVTTRLQHVSGEYMQGTLSVVPRDGSPQSLGSAITYGRRYGAQAMVGLSADEDDDGNQASSKRQPAYQPAPQGKSAFDPKSQAHLIVLSKILEKRNVPVAYHDGVAQAMAGKRLEDLDSVLVEVLKDVSTGDDMPDPDL